MAPSYEAITLSLSVLLLMACIGSVSAHSSDEDVVKTSSSPPLSVLILTSIYPAHFFPMVALGEELISRGHHVTMLGPTMEGYENLPVEAESKGIEFISSSFEPRSTYDISRQSGKHDGSSSVLAVLYNITKQISENWNNSDNHFTNMVKKLKEGDLSYDYVICDNAVINVLFYIINTGHEKVMVHFPPLPLIPQSISPWPFPKMGSSYTDNMSFTDRLWNTAIYGVLEWATFKFLVYMTNMGADMTSNETLDAFLGVKYPIIFNTIIGFDYPRALLPLQHYVGPILTRSPPPIDHTLLSWLNTKPVGSVLYVSMGTSADVTTEIAEAVLSLSHDMYILWSCRNDLSSFTIDKDQVYLTQWTSQLAVLGHPSIGYSVLQCGLTSVQESLYEGVPVVCIPSAFEQFDVSLRLVSQGLGDRVLPNDINENTLRSALKVISTEAVRTKVDKMSKIMKANRGVERAADLVELYADVGHDHGVPAYVRYNWYWYQYYNIDVYLALLVMMVVGVWCVRWACRVIMCGQCCKCGGKRKDKKE